MFYTSASITPYLLPVGLVKTESESFDQLRLTYGDNAGGSCNYLMLMLFLFWLSLRPTCDVEDVAIGVLWYHSVT